MLSLAVILVQQLVPACQSEYCWWIPDFVATLLWGVTRVDLWAIKEHRVNSYRRALG
jgi:hypothetical protein